MTKDEFKQRVFEIINIAAAKISGDYDQVVNQLYTDIFQIKKICSRCEQIFPADTKYYAKHPNTRDNLQSQCRACQSELSDKAADRRREKERIETGHKLPPQEEEPKEETWEDYTEKYVEPGEEIDDYEEEFVDFHESKYAR